MLNNNLKTKFICIITSFVLLCFAPLAANAEDSVCVPVLMYHAVSDDTQNPYAISPALFETHISSLLNDGYTPVFLSELCDYVENGKALPQKPVCITFDDGYLDNYTTAFPILKKYNAKATMFIIGVSVGKSKYKDTTYTMNPHFGYNEAREMLASKLVDIQSHTYDMHQWAPYEGTAPRENILRLNGESVMDYILHLRDDIGKSKSKIEGELGSKMYALAYPGGRYDSISELTLHSMGVKVTLATTMGVNYIKQGDKTTLYKMNRFNMNSDVTYDVLMQMIGR